jgi:hypothetical protein
LCTILWPGVAVGLGNISYIYVIIGNGFATGGCQLADGSNLFPQVFERFVGVPCVSEAVTVGDKVGGGDDAVGGSQVGDDGRCVDVGVSEFVDFQELVIQWVDGGQHKLAKGFVDQLIGGVVRLGFVVAAVRFGDLGGSSVGAMRSLGSGVDWSDEGGSGCSGSNEVGCVGNDGIQVAVDATAELAMDGTGVGIDFFELLDGSGGRFTVNLGALA